MIVISHAHFLLSHLCLIITYTSIVSTLAVLNELTYTKLY